MTKVNTEWAQQVASKVHRTVEERKAPAPRETIEAMMTAMFGKSAHLDSTNR